MKTPRNLSGKDLIKILNKLGYDISRQKGSHIRLSRTNEKGTHHVTVPDHNPLKLGTLHAILNDVSEYLGVPKDDILG